jgi:hypothetical protein
MSQVNSGEQPARSPKAAGAATTRLAGAQRLVARVVWLVLVLPGAGLFLAGLPVYYQELQKACADPLTCGSLNGSLPAEGLRALAQMGLPASGYAMLLTVFFALITAVWWIAGFLLFWRRSDDWMALFAAFVLVIASLTFTNNALYALAYTYPLLALPVSTLAFLGQTSILVFFLLFPNGRLTPRWMGIFLPVIVIYEFGEAFPAGKDHFDTLLPSGLYLLVTVAVNGSIVVAQIYRYARVSTPLQRQQTKWVIFGVAILVGVSLILLAITWLLPLDQTIFLPELWTISLPIATLAVPLAIGFSIARYRLYDIDTLINRALVYGSLTVSLALIYASLVIGLGELARLFTGQFGNNPLVIVASTLAIAALFQPLRRRLQALIDRRFYRRKYDAARTLDAFSATLRNEVDLQSLSEHLTTVVRETMQPAHISLWLRPLARTKPFEDAENAGHVSAPAEMQRKE